MNAGSIYTGLQRRHFLKGIGGAALASLMNPNVFASPQSPHFAPKAKRIIWLTQAGAPSQLDLFDYKPGLVSQFDKDLPDSSATASVSRA
jgi:hypothetical protein